MAILFLDIFGSDPSKMDQTRKFGEQTSRILEFKPKGLDFYDLWMPLPDEKYQTRQLLQQFGRKKWYATSLGG